MLSRLLVDGGEDYQRRLEDLRQTWESLKVKKIRTQKRNNRDERVGDREAKKIKKQSRGPC